MALTIGWRSITAVCWMLEQELAAGAGLLNIAKEQLPRTRSLRVAPVSRAIGGGIATLLRAAMARTVDVHRIESAPTLFQLPGPLRPGQTGERPLLIENVHDSRTETMTFTTSDLRASSGARMPAHCLRFDPASLSVAPRSKGPVLVRLTVPKDTPSGDYVGSLQLRGLRAARVLVKVSIAANSGSTGPGDARR